MEGKITRIVDYGAFAEIEPGVEGLLHLSQLSRSQVENAQEVVKEGETHLLRIVSIDPDRQRIGLSLRAVNANEQIEWMATREAAVAEESGDVDEEPADDEDAFDDTAVADEFSDDAEYDYFDDEDESDEDADFDDDDDGDDD